ncbi:MAG: 50S ribosomal protein L24 [Sedimentisphaeraceae bacterium JB056]
MAARIKKGDTVVVITGTNKGKTGEVLRMVEDGQKVIITGVNMATKHVRPSQKYPQGGRISVEQPIDVSNVMPVNPKTDKGTRVRFEVAKDGSKKRVALDGTELGVVRKAK